jgi:transposase
MGTRVSYPLEVKQKAVEMKMAGRSTKEIMDSLNIKNKTQVETWVRWYKSGEMHRFEQPVGKQYTYGKGPAYTSEMEKLQAENRYLKQQNEVLKKYKELERKLIEKRQLGL